MNKIKKALLEAIKGTATGASMLVPGVSGGTMALLMGFYDKLLDAVGNLFKNPKKNIGTILFYMVFVGLGFILFSNVMTFLLNTIGQPMYLFFIGTILCSIPFLIKKAGLISLKPTDLLFTSAGIIFVALLSFLPEGMFNYTEASGVMKYVALLIAGVLIAVALVLPGISLSHILLVLGIYETVLTAIKAFDIKFLIPIGIFALLGVVLVVKGLDTAMKKFTKQTFMTIIGFVIASSVDIFIKNIVTAPPKGITILFCVIAFVLGGGMTFALSSISKTKNKEKEALTNG